MIISQTPYRVSFAGGGTDLPAFYREDFGAVFSVTIARHIYVTVHGRFTDDIRVAYSKMEVVEDARHLKHELAREAIHMLGLPPRLEITTIGDVPGGTGMGSSSTATVGLLHALHAFKGEICSRNQLAEEACRVEIDHLGKPIGKQDQYAAAFGGLNYIRFNPDETVDVEPVPVRAGLLTELEDRVLLMYTAQQRSADGILKQQSEGTADKRTVLTKMRDLADAMRQSLAGSGDLAEFASLLHEGWELKRSLGFGITNPQIDQWYQEARRVGAEGGKLLGAGGGGFLLLMAPPDRHEAIRAALGRPRELPFKIDRSGSRIIFVSDQH
ncbi:GHMP kinase [Planctomycetales bacterium ZRK34]|nr:GHMP kinase [Planctomycetales bacterium ZRK34]